MEQYLLEQKEFRLLNDRIAATQLFTSADRTSLSCVWDLIGTNFLLIVNVLKSVWLIKKKENSCIRFLEVDFDTVLDNVDKNTQEQILFHLDLFRRLPNSKNIMPALDNK